jgi:hypothetical protein
MRDGFAAQAAHTTASLVYVNSLRANFSDFYRQEKRIIIERTQRRQKYNCS